ncbi:copper amine oxidase N-terminal domain-containing protein [Paenibacillus sp. MBLB4367]|uniref:copper amine oxidase N-terminal domain-containing protein n=1 Tax=Paenibacillus sp. MBLB4367 TaxID=3384767 RepID=UPI0039081D54
MNKKTVLAALVLMLLCSGAAWAEGRYRTIEVYIDKIQVAVNGHRTNIDKESIFYEGSVYVPLRSLAEMLGAKTTWDNETRTVELDFLADRDEVVESAYYKGLYQYMALEHQRNMSMMIEAFGNDDTAKLRKVADSYESLKSLSASILDNGTAEVIAKLTMSVEWLRGGWETKKPDSDIQLAWAAFKENAGQLNELLRAKLHM